MVDLHALQGFHDLAVHEDDFPFPVDGDLANRVGFRVGFSERPFELVQAGEVGGVDDGEFTLSERYAVG